MKLSWILWRKNNKLKATKIMLENLTVTQTTLTPTITKLTERLKLSAYPVEHVETQTAPHKKVTMEPMQQTSQFPGRANWQNRTNLNYRTNYNQECSGCGPSSELNLPRLPSGNAYNRPETSKLITLPPNREVIWEQPPETCICKFKWVHTNFIPFSLITQTTHIPKSSFENNVELQTSSPKGFPIQKSGTTTEQFRKNGSKNGLVPFPNNS